MLREMNTIIKLNRLAKILNYLKITVTVGIIGYTIFKIFGIYNKGF